MIIRKSPSILSWLIILASILFCLIPNNDLQLQEPVTLSLPPQKATYKPAYAARRNFGKTEEVEVSRVLVAMLMITVSANFIMILFLDQQQENR